MAIQQDAHLIREMRQMEDVIKMNFDNRVVIVSNYATEALNNELSYWGDRGFRLVSTEMAANTCGVTVMYLFFTKEA